MENKKSESCSMGLRPEDFDAEEIFYDAMELDVIGFGALNVDKLYNVGKIAEIDGESFISGEEISPGGSAANTIIGLSKLGCSTSYIGKIANDEEGDLLELNLMSNNVFLTNLIYSDNGNSGKVLGFVSEKGERALYVDPGVNDDIIIDEINIMNVNKSKILHYSSFVGNSFYAQKELVKKINDDIILSFDPGMLYVEKGFDELKEILERTNILLINEAELKILLSDEYCKNKKLANGDSPSFRDLAVFARDMGIETVVVKRGDIGAYAINKEDIEVKVPSYKCKAIDTTCAGDSFNSGFLYSYLKGYDLAKSCKIANWVASSSIQDSGIRGQPSLIELNNFEDSLE